MSNKRLKDLVKEIHKLAGPNAGAPPPNQSGQKAQPAKAAPTPGGARPASPGQVRPRGTPVATGAGIKQMQTAVHNLAKMMSSTINYDNILSSLKSPAGADKKEFEASYGRDAFSNFMVNRYLRNADTKGAEYDTDATKTKMQDKHPSELKGMFAVLDGLRRIGKGGTEFEIDGAWGPRTNNALRNVAAIADSVVKLSRDLGIQSKAFDVNKIAGLAKLIPAKDSEITPQEKQKRAPEITELLNGVQTLFTEFKQQVLRNPNYKNFIEGEVPMFQVGPNKKKEGPDLDDGEKPIYEDLKQNGNQSRYVKDTNNAIVPVANISLPPQYTAGKQVPAVPITGADLVDTNTFNAWVARTPALAALQKNNPQTWGNVIKLVLQQTKQQISQKLSGQPQKA